MFLFVIDTVKASNQLLFVVAVEASWQLSLSIRGIRDGKSLNVWEETPALKSSKGVQHSMTLTQSVCIRRDQIPERAWQ